MKSPTRSARRQAGRPHVKVLLAAFVALLILVIFGPAMTQNETGALTGEGNPIRQAGYIVIALVTFLAVRGWREPQAALRVPLPMVIALSICAISLFWAISPGIGFRRLFLTALVIWTLSTAVANLRFGQVTMTLRAVLAMLLVINIIVSVAMPDVGRHVYNVREDIALIGDWRGIMMHKNFAGAVTATTILFFLFEADRVPHILRWPVIVAGAVFLAFTQSKTSVGMLGASIAIGFVFLRYESRHRPLVIVGLLVAALGVTLWLNIYRDFEMYMAADRNAFTGRAFIWETIGNYVEDNWLTGAGYGSFWNIGPESPAFVYGKTWVKQITSAHNGYIDMAVQVGVPCTVAIVLLMLAWPMGRLLTRTDEDGGRSALLLALMIFCAGHNLTESSLLERDLITEVTLVITIALIWKITAPSRQGSGAPRKRSRSGGSLFMVAQN